MWWQRAAWGVLGAVVACGESHSHTSTDGASHASGGDAGSGTGGSSSAAAGKSGSTGAAARGGTGGAGRGGNAGQSSGGVSTAGGGVGPSDTGGSAGQAGSAASSGTGGDAGASGAGGGEPVLVELPVDGYELGSRVYAVSADGTYVVGEAHGYQGVVRGVRWKDAAPTLLDDSLEVAGTSISADGSVVAGYVVDGSAYDAFVWRGTAVELLPGLGNSSEVHAMSNDGNVLVGVAYDTVNEEFPVRWTSDTVEKLPLPDGFTSAVPVGIGSEGGLIAGSGTTDSQYDGVRWQDGGVEGLGELGMTVSDVSDDGRWLVGRYTAEAGTMSAVRHGADGIEVLTVPGGDNWSCHAITTNRDGSIVIGSCTSVDDGHTRLHPFFWNEERGGVALESVLEELGLDGSAYESWELVNLSSDGSTFIANCVKDGTDVGVRVRIDGVFP